MPASGQTPLPLHADLTHDNALFLSDVAIPL
jgi:hypothetical protein